MVLCFAMKQHPMLLIIALLFSLPAFSQGQKMPTDEECTANVMLVEGSARETIASAKKDMLPKMSAEELSSRSYALTLCSIEAINHMNGVVQRNYSEMSAVLTNVLSIRQNAFIVRHGLLKQFLKEDAEGKRQ